MTRDLSHIYHRPGELFWLECDPFQRLGTPCWSDESHTSFVLAAYHRRTIRTQEWITA